MKVLVPVKRVVDYNVKVRVKSDGTGVDLAGQTGKIVAPQLYVAVGISGAIQHLAG